MVHGGSLFLNFESPLARAVAFKHLRAAAANAKTRAALLPTPHGSVALLGGGALRYATMRRPEEEVKVQRWTDRWREGAMTNFEYDIDEYALHLIVCTVCQAVPRGGQAVPRGDDQL